MLRTTMAVVVLGFYVSTLSGQQTPVTPSSLTPVPVQSGVASLTPANTMIQFVGTHAGGDPNPRTGHFQEFKGEARLDAAGKAIDSITVQIQTGSLITPIPNLTNHLKSPDFLDAREYPTATFQTTQITAKGQPSQFEVTGDLTLHGSTVTLVFPATIEVTDAGITLQADLTIDRTQFAMDQLTERVEKEVDLNLAIGKTAQAGGRFDPMAFFRQRDANQDGKLSGDELTDRMRDSLADFDTDQDQSVSQSEFEARVRQLSNDRQRTGRNRRRDGGRRSTNE